jgi:hypothetical protein
VRLREHFEVLLREMDLRYQQRFDANTTAVNAAMRAAEEARSKAENAAEKRFELLNELRVGVATSGELQALEKVVNDLGRRLERTEGGRAGISAAWGFLVGGLGLLAAIVSIVLRI